MTISTDDLVVGDIVIIETGKAVPADCVVFESNDLSCNESAMTGEPDARKKGVLDPSMMNVFQCPFILKSSLTETGNAKAIVLAVGPLT